jgi:hypothetical protein
MLSTNLRARDSGSLHRLRVFLPLILFVAVSFFAFSQDSRADIIAPGPHKTEKRFDGTLKGGPSEFWLETETQKYRLIFWSNQPLEELARNLINKRVVVRGYPTASHSKALDSDIEVASLLEAK